MSNALVLRGQIYKHWKYTYPDNGNVAEKLIVVLNKLHLPTQPIIVVPVATYRGAEKFSPGYKPNLQEYHIPAKQDYFEHDTRIQLSVLGLKADIAEAEFISCQQNDIISKNPLGTLHPQTLSLIFACLKKMDEDIRQDYRQYLF